MDNTNEGTIAVDATALTCGIEGAYRGYICSLFFDIKPLCVTRRNDSSRNVPRMKAAVFVTVTQR